MAWWNEDDLEAAVDRALKEWSEWASERPVADAEFGSGSRNDRIRWFRARLAVWAKDNHTTWAAAGEALACDEKTLRQDGALLEDS